MKASPIILLSGVLAIAGAAFSAERSGKTAGRPRFSHPLEITHPYLPLAKLKTDVLESREGGKMIRVERTVRRDVHKAFQIDGETVVTLAVEDRESENGNVTEVTLDYFAQADDGTVYYLGEDVDEYRNGKVVGHGGAWLLGVHTNIPGVLLPANPKRGDKFRAEDVANITREDCEVVSTTETVSVPAGTYPHCIKIKEVGSDGGVEYKWYAEGVGCVKESGDGGLVLLSHTTVNSKPPE